MGTRKIKDAKDLTTGEKIYFKGHAKATFLSDGRTVEDAIAGGGTGGSGSGITIVDDISKLDPNAPLGTLATVVEPGSIQESSFRDLYQPDANMIDPNTGTLTAPELLSSVSSVSVLAPQNVDSLVESMVYLVTRDFSFTAENMAMIRIVPQQGVMAMAMTGGYDTMQQFVLAEYSQDTMSYTIHNDQVDAFNAVLANGMDWCYFGDPSGSGITEQQFATINLFIKAVAGVPSKAHVYLKKDSWEELYAKDFEKLARNIGTVETSMNAKADKMPIKVYSSGMELKPNVYTIYAGLMRSETIKLADIADSSTYNEYIIEIRCTSTPASVVFKDSNNTEVVIKWANGFPPAFEKGNTYLISIVNGLGLYTKF